MKKIISLISAVAVAIACFTPVTFAAEKPTMNVKADKITDFSGDYAAYEEFANDYGLDIYLVTFTGTGIAMTTTMTGMAKNQFNGDSIVGATVKFNAACSAVRDEEWVMFEKSFIVAPTVHKWADEGDTYTAAMAGTTQLYPTSAMTVTVNDETPALCQLIFAVNPESPVTLTFEDCAINVGTFSKNNMQGAATTYKMGNSTLDMSQEILTLPPASSKVDVTSVTISGATSGKVGDEVQLSATVLPDNATNPEVTWTKVSGAGAVSSTGVVTATAAGDVVVKATADGVDSANYTVTFAPADVVVAPTEAIKTTDADTTGLTDLKGNPVTLTKKYGIAKFSTDIDTVANNYFLDVEAEGGEKTSFAIDFDGIEISATTSFYAIVRSATRVISSIKLRAVAN